MYQKNYHYLNMIIVINSPQWKLWLYPTWCLH